MSQTVSVPGVGDLEFPDGMSEPDMAAAIKKNFPDIHPDPKQDRKAAAAVRQTPKPMPEAEPDLAGAATRTLGRIGHGEDSEGHGLAAGLGEAALGAVTAPLAGLAGAASLPFVGAEKAAKISENLTYSPRTQSGKDVATLLTEPIRMGAQVVGDITGEAGRSMAASVGASPATQGKVEAAGQTVGEAAIPIAMAVKGLGKPERAAAPPVPGKDFSPLRTLTPEQESRYRDLQKGGYKPTLGQVTRDPEQFRAEEILEQTANGRDVLDRKNEQNQKLGENVEKQYPAGTKPLPDSAVGGLVRGSVEAKLLAKKAETRALYEKAKAAGETKTEVDVSPLLDYLEKNKADIESGAIPALGSIGARLKAMLPKPKAPGEAPPAILGADGKPLRPTQEAPKAEPPKLTIDDLESLYKASGRLSKPLDPPSMKAMGEIKGLINDITDGKGGELYKAARKSRLEQGIEFEEQGGVARVVDKASKTDHKVDSSKLWGNIVRGSVEDLKQTLTTLTRDVKPGDKTTAAADSVAVKALQRKSMEHVLEEATKSATKDARGNPQFSPATFKKALDGVGREKLEVLWGKEATDRMYKVVDDAVELKTAPNRMNQSSTALNQKLLADRGFTNQAASAMEWLGSKIGLPGVSSVSKWARNQIDSFGKKQREAAAIDEALNPTKESAAAVKELAKPVNKEISQINMKAAKDRAKPAAAAALTMDKKKTEEATQ